MTLVARRGMFFIVYLFIRGIMRGDPTSIIIAVVVLLGVCRVVDVQIARQIQPVRRC